MEKRLRGFAAMTPERRKEIAAKGGASVPAAKRSFSKNRSLAVTAGAKGGSIQRVGSKSKGDGYGKRG